MKVGKQTAYFLILGSILGLLGWLALIPLMDGMDGCTDQEMIAGITEDYDIAVLFMPMLMIAFTAMIVGWRSVASSLGQDSIWINSANLLLIIALGTGVAGTGLMIGSGSPGLFNETVALALWSSSEAIDLISGVFLLLGLAIIGIVSLQKTSGDRILQILSAILVIGSVIGIANYLINGQGETDLEPIPYLCLLVASVGIGIKSLRTND